MTGDGDDTAGRPSVEAGLRAAATGRLGEDVRAAHLAAIRARAVELGPAHRRTHDRRRLAGWGRVAAALAAVALVTVLGTGGAAWAARDALPGEPLYGLKTASERAAGLLHRTPAQATDHLLDRAERRLDEVGGLVAAGQDGGLIADTVAAHEALLTQASERAAGEPALEARVQAATAAAVSRLRALHARDLPATAAPQARESLQAVIDRLEERAEHGPPLGPPAGVPRREPSPGMPPAGAGGGPAGPPDLPVPPDGGNGRPGGAPPAVPAPPVPDPGPPQETPDAPAGPPPEPDAPAERGAPDAGSAPEAEGAAPTPEAPRLQVTPGPGVPAGPPDGRPTPDGVGSR